MADLEVLDRCFNYVMATFVQRGSAPHFTEIARVLEVAPDEGRRLLHELVETNVMPMWLHPGTDLLASFAPFNNLPTHYLISVAGEQKWFGQ